MCNPNPIDITFDFRSDTPPHKDPDAYSPTLRRYHKLLWRKPLPSGVMFDLVDTEPGVYLFHRSPLGEFKLASDSVIPTFRKEKRLAQVFQQLPETLASFLHETYTIGGMMLFPGNRIDNQMTINGARGFHPKVKDRFDLTLECIRRHYLNMDSPLSDALRRYADYFKLFGDFRGYVEYFLLQDLVTDDYTAIRFFLPFDNFVSSPVPSNMDTYKEHMEGAMRFIAARNRRISAWCKEYFT